MLIRQTILYLPAQLIEIGPGNKAQLLHRDLEQFLPFIGMARVVGRELADDSMRLPACMARHRNEPKRVRRGPRPMPAQESIFRAPNTGSRSVPQNSEKR